MDKQQRLVLIISILASLVTFLDIAVVNVALPAIRLELGGGLASQQWIVDAYLVTLGSLILIAGSFSDLLGRKRILTLGLLGFGLTSALCALAPSAPFLIIARALQGAAAALIVPSSLALIISTFSGAAQGKAIGTWTAWTGMAFLFGPLLGGFLVDNFSWRWVFGINLLPIIIVLWLISQIETKDEVKLGAKIDYLGASLCALGLAGTVFALIEQPNYGWASPFIYTPLLLGLLLLGLFIAYEKKASHPMLPLSLFTHRNFSAGNLATFAIYAGLSAWTFVLIVFVQQVGHYSAFESGFASIPVTLIMFFLASRMGGLAGKYGPRLFMTVGPTIMALALVLISFLVTSKVAYFTEILPGVLLFGLGLATTVAPLTAAVLGDVEKEYAGVASAINNAVARIAGLISVAAIGAVIALQFSASFTQKINQHKLSPEATIFARGAKDKALVVGAPSAIHGKEVIEQAQTQASLDAFRGSIYTIAGLIFLGGVISAVGIQNSKPKSESSAETA